MGRHSSPEQSSFYRSVAGWFLPWVLVAAVAGVAVWVAVGALGQGELDASPPRSSAPEPSPEPRATATPDGESPSPKPEEERPDGDKRKGKRNRNGAGIPDLITEDVTLQVLDATTSAGAGDRVAARLEDLGFEIAATGQASRIYDDTTVFWSYEASKDAARALAKRFGWVLDPAPPNLSRSVAVHVVVGEDEA